MKRLMLFALALPLVIGCGKSRKPTEEGASASTQAEKPRTKTAEKPKPARPEEAVTARQVSEDYGTNEVRAKATYPKKRWRVVGIVQNVKTVGNGAHVNLKGDGFGTVCCKFATVDPELKRLGANVVVIVDGTGDGSFLSTPLFANCEIKGAGYDSLQRAWKEAEKIQ